MIFSNEKPIYLQIADFICEMIFSGVFAPDSRIPSVRDYGAEIGVNPNTMMRTYEKLTDDGIIYNKRGIGYFVSPDAKETILASERKDFMENVLPQIRRRMKLLGIPPEAIFENGGGEV